MAAGQSIQRSQKLGSRQRWVERLLSMGMFALENGGILSIQDSAGDNCSARGRSGGAGGFRTVRIRVPAITKKRRSDALWRVVALQRCSRKRRRDNQNDPRQTTRGKCKTVR